MMETAEPGERHDVPEVGRPTVAKPAAEGDMDSVPT